MGISTERLVLAGFSYHLPKWLFFGEGSRAPLIGFWPLSAKNRYYI